MRPRALSVPDLDAIDRTPVAGQIYLTCFASGWDSRGDGNREFFPASVVHYNTVEFHGGILDQNLNSPEGALGFAYFDSIVVRAAVYIGFAEIFPTSKTLGKE